MTKRETHLDRRLYRLRLHGIRLPHAVVVHVDQLAALAVHAPRRVAVDGVLGLESTANKLIGWNVASQTKKNITDIWENIFPASTVCIS